MTLWYNNNNNNNDYGNLYCIVKINQLCKGSWVWPAVYRYNMLYMYNNNYKQSPYKFNYYVTYIVQSCRSTLYLFTIPLTLGMVPFLKELMLYNNVIIPGSASTESKSDLRIIVVHSPGELKCVIEHLTVVELWASVSWSSWVL